MCDAICDGGVRCHEPAEARRARQRVSYAMSRLPAGGTALAVRPAEPEPEPAPAPPTRPDLAAFDSDPAAAELAVTAWGAELSRRAHEIAGLTPEEILAGNRQRQHQAEYALPELEQANKEAGETVAALRRQLAAPPDADPTLVNSTWDGKLTWNKETPQWAAYQEALERFHRVSQSYRDALQLVQTAAAGRDEETIRQLDLVSAAYLQVLTQERPMGGKVAVGKDSSAR